jgi:hypothetical protein
VFITGYPFTFNMYHSKLFTTRSGAILDEVKSLLQKSLRRKDEKRVAQCFNEIVYNLPDKYTGQVVRKDQLPWGCLLTYLFEDHCLVDTNSLCSLYENFRSKDKMAFLKKLLKVRTSRVAACLPVYSMSDDLSVDFHPDIEVPAFAQHLFDQNIQRYRHLKADPIMAHFIQAWKHKDGEGLIFYGKLINMIQEKEKAKPTGKAKAMVRGMVQRKGNIYLGATHLVLSVLLQKDVTKDSDMRRFLHVCLRFCCVTDSTDTRRDGYHRLIMFSVISKLIHGPDVDPNPVRGVEDLTWDSVPVLQDIPPYAVDKHTYRGKNGCSTKKYKDQGNMSDEVYESFHGLRPNRGIQDFFIEGSITKEPSLVTNPYWETTMKMYLSAPPDKQRTVCMTPTFYELLFTKEKELFNFDQTNGGVLPLLQKPTSGNKVYTRVDVANGEVIKGPYTDGKYALVVSLHHKMIALGDKHTLPITQEYPYVKFPLIRKDKTVVKVSKITFEDHIAKMTACDVQFVTRDSLGLTQLHRMSHYEVQSLPMTVWVHFALRYALNIGDSGLYNAISNGSQVFGIDMEERRTELDDSKFTSVCDFLFSIRPSFDMSKIIEARIRRDNMDFVRALYPVLGHAIMTEDKNSRVIVRLNNLIKFVKSMGSSEMGVRGNDKLM